MVVDARRCMIVLAALLCSSSVSARQDKPSAEGSAGGIVLDVVVTPKSGPPVGGLQQADFTVLDNKVAQAITSFQAIDGRQAPIEVILLIDAVNTDYQEVAYERQQIDKFLQADGGHVAHPIALAVLTDTGTQLQPTFSTDGSAAMAALDQYTVALRSIRRSAGYYGAVERTELSVRGLQQLVAREAPRPGRKVIFWVSPGWPLLTGPRVELENDQQRQIFGEIVELSTQLRRGGVTLYSVDPLGTADVGAGTFYWQTFLKGVSKPNQVQLGNLALQVIAVQSGGLALNSSNDIAAQLQKCMADTGAYYELSFDPQLSDKPNEYHHLEIRVAKPGLTARTRQGYYSQSH